MKSSIFHPKFVKLFFVLEFLNETELITKIIKAKVCRNLNIIYFVFTGKWVGVQDPSFLNEIFPQQISIINNR